MSSPVISVEHLSKRYLIGHQRGGQDGLRHRIEDAARAPWRWLRSSISGQDSALIPAYLGCMSRP